MARAADTGGGRKCLGRVMNSGALEGQAAFARSSGSSFNSLSIVPAVTA